MRQTGLRATDSVSQVSASLRSESNSPAAAVRTRIRGQTIATAFTTSHKALAEASPPPPPPLPAHILRGGSVVSATLESKLRQVGESIDEFFGDRNLVIAGSSTTVADRARTTLSSLAAHLHRVPFVNNAETLRHSRDRLHTTKGKRWFLSKAQRERRKQAKENDDKMLRQDALVCAVSMLGVVLMLINSLVIWNPRKAPSVGFGSPNSTGSAASNAINTNNTPTIAPLLSSPVSSFSSATDNTASSLATVLNYIIFFSSLFAVVRIAQSYYLVMRLKQQEWSLLSEKEVVPQKLAFSLWKSSYRWEFLAEVLLHSVFPYPWYSSLTSRDAKYLELFMLVRLYTVLRLLHRLSPLYRLRHDIVSGNSELKAANFQVRFADTMKVYFYEYTILSAVLMYAFVTIFGGFAVFVAERDANNGYDPVPVFPANSELGFGFNRWLDGIYFMVVSVRTIGYGEVRPVTIVGRGLTIVFQFAGMSVEALLGSVVINKIAKSKEERIIDEYLKSFYAWHEFRVASAMLIQATWKTCLRYRYLHHLVKKEAMERVLRVQTRRREFLTKIVAGNNTFAVPTYENLLNEQKALTVKNIKLRFEECRVPELGLRSMLLSIANQAKGRRLTSTRLSAFDIGRGQQQQQGGDAGGGGTNNDIYERMPYMRKPEERHSSIELRERFEKLFKQDTDVSRFGKMAATSTPPGFNLVRTFAATKKVVGKHGERRVPVGEGHKAAIQLQALKQFRAARREFKASLASSSDHVVDSKLLFAFELLSAASRKVKRNAILLEGLRRVSLTQLDAIDNLINLSLGGGVLSGAALDL